jgi:putative transposase
VTRIHDLFLPPDPKPHRDTRPTGTPMHAAITPRQLHDAKRNVRIAAVAFRRWIRRYHPRLDPDRLLRLPTHTLVRWQRRWISCKLHAKPRGRPLVNSHRNHRNEVKHLLDTLGPHIGCSTLELFFPLMSRRELRRLLKRYRRIWRKKERLQLHQLHWHRPGSVWAIDYTQPPAPIDGLYSSILVVRDLASGFQLLALPTTDQTAKTARDALLPLFRKFGPPIVLKSDNGSFRAHEMRRFLSHWNVCPLLSPPRTPQYNGAVEAGIGSIMTRAHHIAAQHGRPGEWTCDDVEAARLLANATARPHGRRGPTPQAAWKRHDDIALAERNRFFETLKLFQKRLDSRREAAAPSSEPVARTDRDPALFHRIAIRRALVARGLLTITKPRRITPPIKSQKVDKIT